MKWVWKQIHIEGIHMISPYTEVSLLCHSVFVRGVVSWEKWHQYPHTLESKCNCLGSAPHGGYEVTSTVNVDICFLNCSLTGSECGNGVICTLYICNYDESLSVCQDPSVITRKLCVGGLFAVYWCKVPPVCGCSSNGFAEPLLPSSREASDPTVNRGWSTHPPLLWQYLAADLWGSYAYTGLKQHHKTVCC